MELDIMNQNQNYLFDVDLENFKNKTKKSIYPRTFTKKPKQKYQYNYNHNQNHDQLIDQLYDKKSLTNISEKLTDNTESIKRIITECPKNQNHEAGYLSQFDAQTFDSVGLPSAPNDVYSSNDKSKLADLERKLSYQGGWTNYDNNDPMSYIYNVVSDDQLVHNNMMPFFSTKNGYGSNDTNNNHVVNFKNDLFTGVLKDTWLTKQENSPLFAPMANLTYMHGTPIRTTEEQERCVMSQYKQNETIIDSIKVTPGIGIGAHDVGTHGYHSMYRDLGKTIDELRVKPKITFEGRVIEGQRGQARPMQAPVIKYGPDTFKTNTDADLLPTHVNVDGPKPRDNFIMKETDRSHQSIEYTGGAYVSQDTVGQNVPEYMRPKQKYSTRQNFILPKPLQKFSKVEAVYNPNHDSYDLPATIKDQTIQNNNPMGIIGAVQGASTYANNNDILQTTLKELTAAQPVIYTQLTPNTMRGTAHSMDITGTTIKETTSVNKLNPHAISLSEGPMVYFSDITKTTMKELAATQPITPYNPGQNINMYVAMTDTPKTTNKETVVNIPYQTTVTPVNQQQRAPHPQDITRTTGKETIVNIPYQTMVTPVNQHQRAPHPQDITRTTGKETIVTIPYQTTLTPINQQQRAPHPQDITRTTGKETIVTIPYQTTITPINQQQRAPHPQDITRVTGKQTLVNIPYQTMVTPINQHQRAPHPQDITRTTGKEILVQTPWNTSVVPINQHQRAPHPQDIARTTGKETIINIPYQTMVTPVGQNQRAPDPQDINRTTIKDTLVNIPINTYLTGVDQQQGQATTFNRLPLKTTTKEGIVEIPYNTMTTVIDHQQGTAATYSRSPLRATVKEGTIEIPYSTHVVAVGQAQRAPDPQDIVKTTLKEQLIEIPYNTHVLSPNRSSDNATTYNRDPLKATIKESTIENDYVAPLRGENRPQSYESAYNVIIDDKKESVLKYRPPTDCNINMGPDPAAINIQLRSDDNRSRAPMVGCTINNNLDRLKTISTSKINNCIPSDRFIDPVLLKQLESNPFNLSIYTQN